MGWVEGVKMGTDWYNERMAKERQDRVDAQNKQLFDLKMEEANRAKLERQQLSDASKPAVTSIQDAAVDLGNGQKVYTMPRGIDGADVAATDARQARMMTERDTGQGAPAPQVTPAKYTMNGKAFADLGSMQAAATEYDSPQALAQRQAAVLNSQGNPMGAMQLANAAVDSKLKGYQLSDAETAQANTKFNTHVDEVIARSPDKWTGLAAIGTETQVGPMKDVKVRVQSDGASMRFVSTMPDGTEKPGAVYPNTDEGFAKARYDLMKLDPATKSKILDEQVKTERDQGNKDADRKVKIQSEETDRKYKMGMLDIYNNREARQGLAGGSGTSTQSTQVSLKDQRDHSDDVLKRLGKPADFATQAEADAWQAKHFDELSTNAAFFKLNAAYGTALTGDETMKAYRLSQDPKNVKTLRDTETGEYFKAVNVNGTLVRTNRASPPGTQADAPKPPDAKPGASPPVVNMQNTIKPELTSKSAKVLSEAAPIKTMLGMGKPEPAYNIQLPDGTTKIMSVSQMEKMGFPINRAMGKTFYDPNYR